MLPTGCKHFNKCCLRSLSSPATCHAQFMWWECFCWAQRGGFDCRRDQLWAQALTSSASSTSGEVEGTANNLNHGWEGGFLIVSSGSWGKEPGQWSFPDQCDTIFQCLPVSEQPREEFILQPGAPRGERWSPWANRQWLQELWKHHSVAAEYHQLPHCSSSVFQGKAFQATHLHQL